MSSIKNIKVFVTSPHSCSYLDDKEATTLFVDPDTDITREAYEKLNEIGFRRSGKHFYLPHCGQCQECIPTRIPVVDFKLSKSQLRIQKKNRDLTIIKVQNISSSEHYELYASYVEARHKEGDMYPPSREQYSQFLGDGTRFSRFIEFRDQEKLIGVSVLDDIPGSLSAIYTFFAPEENKRSLGVFSILSAIDIARLEEKNYVYLGYWIRDCKKMKYKTDYRPIELLINGMWRLLQ